MNLENVESMAWQGNSYLWIGNRDGVARIHRPDVSVTKFNGIGCTSILVTRDQHSIWCTGTGIASRYDGQSWQSFKIDAYQIVESKDGTLWAGTMRGLSRFDSETREWLSVLEAPKIAEHFVFTNGPGIHLSFSSGDGALWFYSFSEPYVGTTRWTEGSHQTWQPTGEWTIVQPKLQARDGTIWGVGDESIIAQWDGVSWKIWQPFRLKPAIDSLVEALDGSIWAMAVADGVGRWDGQLWEVWARDEAILQACPGMVQGKECFSNAHDTKYHLEEGLGKPNSSQARLGLTALLETQGGNIWLGTTQEGISRWNGSKWRHYTMADGLSSESITVLAESPDAVLWAGTRDQGVNYFDANADTWRHLSIE